MQAKQVSATFDLGSSMTSAGLLLQTAAICTVGGPMLPPLLVKVLFITPTLFLLLLTPTFSMFVLVS